MACKHVLAEHPELSLEQITRLVDAANAKRIMGYPDALRWLSADTTAESIPDLLGQINDRTKSLAALLDLLLVLPFCPREVPLLVKVVDWMNELGPQGKTDVLLTYDRSVAPAQVRQVKLQVLKFARTWAELCYPVPPSGYFAPNWAFQCTARFISGSMKRPWLWFEADMVPTKPGWMQTLQAAYEKAGKPCMGTVVPGMGHVNGTAIYPADYATWATHAMGSYKSAWDMEQAQDMKGKVHEASYLMQHVWGTLNGKPHPSQGPPVSFRGPTEMAWLNPNAVTFHRCKDSTLIDRLRERKP